MPKNFLRISSLIFILFLSAWIASFTVKKNYLSPKKKPANNQTKITLYKSPNCGCCVKYVDYLRKNHFDVEVVPTVKMEQIKDKYNIPRQMESCHTAVIGKYFIEGHIPIEVINKLLKDKPLIDGIALPNMPAGTPGMPGTKQGSWIIYSLKGGDYNNYLTI